MVNIKSRLRSDATTRTSILLWQQHDTRGGNARLCPSPGSLLDQTLLTSIFHVLHHHHHRHLLLLQFRRRQGSMSLEALQKKTPSIPKKVQSVSKL